MFEIAVRAASSPGPRTAGQFTPGPVASESGYKWGINIENIEGVGSVEGVCPPPVWGLSPRKKNNFGLKIMQF